MFPTDLPESSPVVDVLLPVRSPNPKWLAQSLRSLLQQTAKSFRVVLVLHPDDFTMLNMFKRYSLNLEVVWAPAHGDITHALNAGLAACEAPLIARLDADDYMAPERLQIQTCVLNKQSDLSVIGSNYYLVNACSQVVGSKSVPTSARGVHRMLRWKTPIGHPTVMYRKDAIEGVGGYNNNAVGAEDYELWLRLASVSEIGTVPEFLTYYRVHDRQISRTKAISISTASTIAAARISLAKSNGESVTAARGRQVIWAMRQKSRRVIQGI